MAMPLRLPILRYGRNEPPIAWWEWLFLPIIIPYVIVLVLIGFFIFPPIEYVRDALRIGRKNKLRQKLESRGRYMEWAQVEHELINGRGTLIVEHQPPIGHTREWWTPEDLVGGSPVTLPSGIGLLPKDDNKKSELEAYAQSCIARLIDRETGEAKLTERPYPQLRRYPKARVIELASWYGGSFIADVGADSLLTHPSNIDRLPDRHLE